MQDLNLKRLRRQAVEEAIRRTGSLSDAAKLLGIDRTSLSKLISRAGIKRKDDAPLADGWIERAKAAPQEIALDYGNLEAWKLTMLDHFHDLHAKNDLLERRNKLLQARLDEAMAALAKAQRLELRATA